MNRTFLHPSPASLLSRLGSPLFEGTEPTGSTTPPADPPATPPKAPAPPAPDAETEALKRRWNLTQVLMDETADPTRRQQAAASLMREAGVPEAEIQARLAPPTPDPKPNRKGKQETTEEEDEDPTEALAQEIAQLRKDQQRLTSTQLREKYNTSLTSALDSTTEVRTLLAALDRINPDPASKAKRKTILAEKVDRAAKEMLREKRASSLSFDDGWIPEVMPKAIKKVLDEYRTEIGDPDKLGRTPETGVDEADEFLAETPVPKPTFKAGTSRQDLEKNLADWTRDYLSRGEKEPTTEGTHA